MEKMWCSGDSRHRNVIVARGPSALTPDQIKYSVLCTVTSSVGRGDIAARLGALSWMEIGVGRYIIVAVIAVLCCMHIMYEGVVKIPMWMKKMEPTSFTFGRQ